MLLLVPPSAVLSIVHRHSNSTEEAFALSVCGIER